MEKLDAIETAASLAEARACAAELRDFPLTESFRIRGLCEIFGGYGRALERLERDGTLDALPLAQQQRWAWVRFRETLEEREAQVATLYAREIREIAYLVLRAEQAAELAELREAARRARHRLTVQMSEFDALAGEFRHR